MAAHPVATPKIFNFCKEKKTKEKTRCLQETGSVDGFDSLTV